MDLAPERIDHGYLKFAIVSQAFVAEVLGKFFAVSDRFRICLELNADSVPHRNAVFHIEEKLLYGGGLLRWRLPGLCYRDCDDVPLYPFALRASKRSQALAQRARLNRRQPHGRTAGRALRTLVLFVEHVSAPSVRSP
jgi:hypothetical protein